MSVKNKQNFETDYRWVGNFTRGRRKGNEHIYIFRNADTLDATQKRGHQQKQAGKQAKGKVCGGGEEGYAAGRQIDLCMLRSIKPK